MERQTTQRNHAGKATVAVMSAPFSNRDSFDRYLSILGIRRKEPSVEALRELVEAHMLRIAFESISKIHHKKHIGLTGLPGIELYLEGVEQYGFGGTCYSNNFYLNQLLAHLGYGVKLCGADMSVPDVHVVNMVTVGGREYIVDAGYAAPFLTPLPRDLTSDHVITLGRDRYVLKPQDENGCSCVELYREGELIHGYLAKPEPRTIEDFREVISDSFLQDATFMNALLLARFYHDQSFVIHNLSVIESRGATWNTETLANGRELARVVEEHFGIPRDIVMEAVEELGDLKNPWS
jgi:N-hydroxyarylamine O-acetyltransferase